MQVVVIPVRDNHTEATEKIVSALKNANIRVEHNTDTDSLGKRIHAAKKMNTPYIIIIGDKEVESGNITVEGRAEKLENISLESFIEKISSEVKNRTLN